MIAMIRRELGQHWRWAWPLPLVVLAAMSLDAWPIDAQLDMTTSSVRMVPFFGFALLGGALGFVQFFGLARGGARDVLLHRPAPRAALFHGKSIAGVLLLLWGAGLPLAALVAWRAWTPRPFSPFGWEQALPGIVDLLGALVFYFAGCLVALREVRWHGGRLLPIAAAGAAMLCAFVVPQAGLALLIQLAALIPMGLAARAAFLGSPALRRVSDRVALGGVLLVGVMMAGGGLMALVGQSLYVEAPIWSAPALTRSGELVQQVFREGEHLDTRFLGESPETAARSLGPLARSERKEMLAPVQRLHFSSTGQVRSAWYRSRSLVASLLRQSPSERWYFHHPSRLVHAYDRTEGRLLGWIGPEGRREAGEPRPVPFAGALRRVAPLTTQRGIYRTTEDEESVRRIFEAPVGERIRYSYWYSGDPACLLLTDERFRRLDRDGGVVLDVPSAESEGDFVSLAVHDASDGSSVVIYMGRALGAETRDLVIRLDEQGRETGRRVVASERHAAELTTAGNLLAGLLVPPSFRVAWPPFRLAAHLQAPGWFRGVESGPWRQAAAVVSALACGLLAAVLARRRRSTLRAQLAWGVVGLAFGPAGLVLLFVLDPRPVFEPCTCGQPRRVDSEQCAACGAGWPEAEPDGTEILA